MNRVNARALDPGVHGRQDLLHESSRRDWLLLGGMLAIAAVGVMLIILARF